MCHKLPCRLNNRAHGPSECENGFCSICSEELVSQHRRN